VLQGRSSVPRVLARRLSVQTEPPPGRTRCRGPWVPWVGVLGAWVGWELFCYVSAPRRAHPTLSVVLNSIDDTHLGHAAAFAAWLALGWYLVTR
jgi:hypothetical protein